LVRTKAVLCLSRSKPATGNDPNHSKSPAAGVAAFEWVPTIAGGFSALVGVLVLLGWWRGIDPLQRIIPGLVPTIPNAAVAFIIGGLAVMSASREERDARFVPVTRGLAVVLTR
jgi:hypothetical protein